MLTGTDFDRKRPPMLESLDTIDWSSLTHAYGPATDVPDLLRALVSDDPDQRLEAIADAHEKIWHQGTIFPASAAVVPFLCELLNDPDVRHKAGVVSLLGCIATGEGILAYCMRFDGEETCRRRLADDGKSLEAALAEEAAMMQAIHDGVSPVVQDLLPWLHDAEGLGTLVAEVLGEFPEHASWLLPAIDASLAEVSDAYVRQTLTESRGRLAALMTAEYLEERAQRGSRKEYEKVLRKVKKRPPASGDELPAEQ